jgi:DNA-binding transcriptional MerR regulator
VQRLSQEEGINLNGIKRILELELAERRSRVLVAELTAEISQLRAELESTRAVAARLATLARGRTDSAALVPVRSSATGRSPAGGAGAGVSGTQAVGAADLNPQPRPNVADAG